MIKICSLFCESALYDIFAVTITVMKGSSFMPRKGENIYKRKDGRWEGRFIKEHINGKAKYGYVFARSYKEVKEKLNVAKGTISNNINDYTDSKSIVAPLFSKIVKEWLNIKSIQLKRSSFVKYENIINKYLLPQFGEKNIKGIIREDIQSFILELLEHGGRNNNGLAPKTINCIICVMKNIFDYAVINKGYTLISFEGLYVKQIQKPMRIFSVVEQDILTKFLLEHQDYTSLGILISLYTGIRIGELCALKWEDISYEDKCIYIHNTMQRLQTKDNTNKKTEIIISSPKSICSIRTVPIPDELFRLMQVKKRNPSSYILTGKINIYVEPRTIQNRFKSIVKKCEIADANFHSLRHTFATRCIELGFDIKSLSEILGHASVNITLNKYVHPSMDLKMKNMNMLSEFLAVK